MRGGVHTRNPLTRKALGAEIRTLNVQYIAHLSESAEDSSPHTFFKAVPTGSPPRG